MALLLFILFAVAETGFCIMGLTRTVSMKEWTRIRLAVNVIETAVFLVMLLLPGIDLGFRFLGLFLLLCIRIVISLVSLLIHRQDEKQKKKPAIAAGAVLGTVLIALAMLPAFAFTDYRGRPVTGSSRVAEEVAILIDHSRKDPFESDGSFREVPVHFYYPEEISGIQEHSLPLVIFSHGAFGYYQSNVSTYTELASNGYVVVSLDHPHHSFFTEDSAGKTVTVDPGFFQDALRIQNSGGEIPEEEERKITSAWMELRLADMNFVLDTFGEAGGSGQLSDSWYFGGTPEDTFREIMKSVDTEKIGLMGHSLGGATAVTAGRRDDVSAVIDLDGTMLGERTGVKDGLPVINDTPYTTPLLCIDNESHHNERIEAKEAGYPYVNNVVLDNAPAGFSTYIEGAGHMNFTDLPLISPMLANLLGTGSTDPEACIDRINALVLQFFDCYLKGKGSFAVDDKY